MTAAATGGKRMGSPPGWMTVLAFAVLLRLFVLSWGFGVHSIFGRFPSPDADFQHLADRPLPQPLFGAHKLHSGADSRFATHYDPLAGLPPAAQLSPAAPWLLARSAPALPHCTPHGFPLRPSAISRAAEAFTHWDGLFFLEAVQFGYHTEKMHAFFPLYPTVVSATARTLDALPHLFAGAPSSAGASLTNTLCARELLVFAALLVSNLSAVAAAVVLYVLSRRVLSGATDTDTGASADADGSLDAGADSASEAVALGAALIFAATPAGVFYSAAYSEALYALLSLSGCLLLDICFHPPPQASPLQDSLPLNPLPKVSAPQPPPASVPAPVSASAAAPVFAAASALAAVPASDGAVAWLRRNVWLRVRAVFPFVRRVLRALPLASAGVLCCALSTAARANGVTLAGFVVYPLVSPLLWPRLAALCAALTRCERRTRPTIVTRDDRSDSDADCGDCDACGGSEDDYERSWTGSCGACRNEPLHHADRDGTFSDDDDLNDRGDSRGDDSIYSGYAYGEDDEADASLEDEADGAEASATDSGAVSHAASLRSSQRRALLLRPHRLPASVSSLPSALDVSPSLGARTRPQRPQRQVGTVLVSAAPVAGGPLLVLAQLRALAARASTAAAAAIRKCLISGPCHRIRCCSGASGRDARPAAVGANAALALTPLRPRPLGSSLLPTTAAQAHTHAHVTGSRRSPRIEVRALSEFKPRRTLTGSNEAGPGGYSHAGTDVVANSGPYSGSDSGPSSGHGSDVGSDGGSDAGVRETARAGLATGNRPFAPSTDRVAEDSGTDADADADASACAGDGADTDACADATRALLAPSPPVASAEMTATAGAAAAYAAASSGARTQSACLARTSTVFSWAKTAIIVRKLISLTLTSLILISAPLVAVQSFAYARHCYPRHPGDALHFAVTAAVTPVTATVTLPPYCRADGALTLRVSCPLPPPDAPLLSLARFRPSALLCLAVEAIAPALALARPPAATAAAAATRALRPHFTPASAPAAAPTAGSAATPAARAAWRAADAVIQRFRGSAPPVATDLAAPVSANEAGAAAVEFGAAAQDKGLELGRDFDSVAVPDASSATPEHVAEHLGVPVMWDERLVTFSFIPDALLTSGTVHPYSLTPLTVTPLAQQHSQQQQSQHLPQRRFLFLTLPWSPLPPLGVYSSLQARYWNVGVFRYFTLAQAPNFLLAAPVLMAAVLGCLMWVSAAAASAAAASVEAPAEVTKSATAAAVAERLRVRAAPGARSSCVASSLVKTDAGDAPPLGGRARMHRTLSTFSTTGAAPGAPALAADTSSCVLTSAALAAAAARSAPREAPYWVHLAVLALVAFFVMHVQVATRFLSACPALYWGLARVVVRARARSGRRTQFANLLSATTRLGAGTAANSVAKQPSAAATAGASVCTALALAKEFVFDAGVVSRWAAAYVVAGTAMFVMFLPWT